MATQWISPTWRMPENSNQSKVDNYSLEFNGTDDYVAATYSGDVYACSIWFKPSNTITTSTLVEYLISFGNEFSGILLGSSTSSLTDELITIVNDGGVIGRSAYTAAGGTISDTWHHLCFNWSGSVYEIWLDGVNVQNTSNGTPALITSSEIRIGRNSSPASTVRDFNGEIGQTTIYDSALTSDQIIALHHSGTPVNPMALTPLPTAYYPLGGGSTGDAADPATTLTVPNESVPSATVFDFDGGIDNGININNNSSLEPLTSFTLSCWIKSETSQNSYAYPVYKQSSNSAHVAYGFYLQGTQTIATTVTTSGVVTSDSIGDLRDDKWHHIVQTYDGSGMKVYLDGVQSGSTKSITGDVGYSTTHTKLYIGETRHTSPSGYFSFKGEISNVALFNSALPATGTESVESLYNNGTPPNIASYSNLKAWYKLNVDTSNWDLTSTSWSITKIGSPYFNGASDGAYAQNGVLRSQDTDSYTIASGDYFQWNSPTIYTSGSDIVLSSSGGEANGQTSGVEIIYQYNIDNTGWTTWHQHADTGTTDQAYAVPSTSPLTVSSNIKIRVQLAGGPNNNSFVDVSDINITGGTSSYSEDFSNATKYGWFGGSETANPTTTAWIFTDSSGESNTGTSSGMTTANLITSDLTRSIPYSSYSMYFDGTADRIDTSSIDLGLENTISFWAKRNGVDDFAGMVFGGLAASNYFTVFISNSLLYRTGSGANTFNNADIISAIEADAWFHCSLVRNNSGADVLCYINGILKQTLTGITGSGDNTIVRNIGARWNTNDFYITGNLSNIAVWSSALTQDQILTIYNGGVPNDISSLSPTGWWSLAGDSYFNGNDWICPDLGSGGNNGTSSGMGGTELVGDGPGSTANGIATSMDIPANLKGNAPNSTKNAFSINMTAIDRVTSVPG